MEKTLGKIDNTPEAIERDENEAEKKASTSPLRKYDPSPRDFAVAWGRTVLGGMKDVGKSKAEVEKAKSRMARWVNVVERYGEDIEAVEKNRELSSAQKQMLKREMIAARDSLRVEIFGS